MQPSPARFYAGPERSSKNPSAASDIAVVVCAEDEERHLRSCLDSVTFADAVFVVDGGSTDATTQSAEELGAKKVRHTWPGHAAQKNWGLDSLQIKTRWVLRIEPVPGKTDVRDDISGQHWLR